jgi:hypothetical protein
MKKLGRKLLALAIWSSSKYRVCVYLEMLASSNALFQGARSDGVEFDPLMQAVATVALEHQRLSVLRWAVETCGVALTPTEVGACISFHDV